MTNLTIAVDEDVLRRARIRALEEGSSVNALLREYLIAYAASDDRVTHDRAVAERLPRMHDCTDLVRETVS